MVCCRDQARQTGLQQVVENFATDAVHLLAAKFWLVIIDRGMVIIGTTGTNGMVVIICVMGINMVGMCNVVILVVIVGMVIEQAIVGIIIKLGIVGIATNTVSSTNLTFCVIITAWSG